MARLGVTRHVETESGAYILTEWLKLPHLHRQLKNARLNTHWLFDVFFIRDRAPRDKDEYAVHLRRRRKMVYNY